MSIEKRNKERRERGEITVGVKTAMEWNLLQEYKKKLKGKASYALTNKRQV